MEGTGIFLAILAVIGFLGAIPQLWGSNWRKIWLVYYKGILSWDSVHKATLKVIEKLRKHDFRPTVIIGVGRGGMVSAGLLCSELTGEDLVESFQINYIRVENKPAHAYIYWPQGTEMVIVWAEKTI